MEDITGAWLAPERPVDWAQDKLFGRRPELVGRFQFIAEHIASSVLSPAESSGTVFGISAPWGSGKSSALRVIIDLVYQKLRERLPELSWDVRGRGFKLSSEYVLTTSTFRANLHVDSAVPARLSLAYDVLQGFPEEYSTQLLESLKYPREERGLAAPIIGEMFLRSKLQEYGAAGPVVERWILDSFLQHRAEMQGNFEPKTEDHPLNGQLPVAHAHIQMIDDLDRCPQAFTADVLAALSFWSSMPNLFFVVAADEDHLKRSAQAAVDLDETYQGEALEKFVHFQLRMPALINTTGAAARYALRLFPQGAEMRPGVSHFKALLENFREDAPYDLMAPTLSAGTPRQAKRLFNELLQEFWILRDLEGDSVKRIIARMMWPVPYRDYVEPLLFGDPESDALGVTGPTSKLYWLTILLQLAQEVLAAGGLSQAAASARLIESAHSSGIDLQSCPPELILYLAADPPIALPAPGRSIETTNYLSRPQASLALNRPATTDTKVVSGSDDLLAELVDEANIAQGLDDIQGVRRLTSTIVQMVQSGQGTPDHAAALGNLALRLERLDPSLAWLLHQAAATLDPAHANIRLNIANFLVTQKERQFVPVIEEQLAWLAENAPDHRASQQKLTAAKLAVLVGNDIEGFEELIEAAESGNISMIDVARLASTIGREVVVEQLLRPFFEDEFRKGEAGLASDVLVICQEILQLSGDESWHLRGLDILRYIVSTGFARDSETAAINVSNLAISLDNAQFDTAAAAIYRLAYELRPGAVTVRRAYTRFLISREDAQNAHAVQQGQQVSIAKLSGQELVDAMSEVPRYDEDVWWEEFHPVDAHLPIPEVRA